MQQCSEEELRCQRTEGVDDWHVMWLQQTVTDEDDISAKLSPVCPAKRNANLWIVILCTKLMANKFDLIWFDLKFAPVNELWACVCTRNGRFQQFM